MTLSNAITPGMVADYADIFEDSFEMDGETGCWEWLKVRTPAGYGRLGVHGKTQAAHRVAYALEVGAIPAGMDLDHLCRNRGCVNPEHLEIVTRSENVRRSTVGLEQRSRTHCRNGHEYDEANTYVNSAGHRQCRVCRRASQNAIRQLERAN